MITCTKFQISQMLKEELFCKVSNRSEKRSWKSCAHKIRPLYVVWNCGNIEPRNDRTPENQVPHFSSKRCGVWRVGGGGGEEGKKKVFLEASNMKSHCTDLNAQTLRLMSLRLSHIYLSQALCVKWWVRNSNCFNRSINAWFLQFTVDGLNKKRRTTIRRICLPSLQHCTCFLMMLDQHSV